MNELAAEYLDEVLATTALLRAEEVASGCQLLADAIRNERGVYLCGNGGSASTASHLAVDLGKNLHTATGRRLRVISLTDNVPWLTALANDLGYDNCFVDQLRNYLQPDDLVIGISASGNSKNVVRAFEYARDLGAERLALIGFDGGRLAQLAPRRVWVDSYDYGIVESAHLIVAHAWVRMLSAGGSEQTQGGDARAEGGRQAARERAQDIRRTLSKAQDGAPVPQA